MLMLMLILIVMSTKSFYTYDITEEVAAITCCVYVNSLSFGDTILEKRNELP